MIRGEKIRKMLLGLACLLWLSVTGHAAGEKPDTSAETPNALLWKIEKDGCKTSYLWGTIHLPRKDIAIPPKTVLETLEKCESIATEIPVEPRDQQEAQRMMQAAMKIVMAPPGRSLQASMDTDAYVKLSDLVKRKNLDIAALDKNTPLIITLQVLMDRDPGTLPMDHFLWKHAGKHNIELDALETIEEQVDALEKGLPYDEQIKALEKSVGDYAAFQKKFAAMTDAYKACDIAKLYELVTSEDTHMSVKILVTDRNIRMADRLAEKSKTKRVFAAVGAAHLPGEKGIIMLLRKKGFTVTPVLLPKDKAKKPDNAEAVTGATEAQSGQ